MQRLCVFCGSNAGGRPVYADAARRFGTALVSRGLGLVYGGGHVGLMGVLADAVLAAGGEVYGVIPRQLADKELAHGRLTEVPVAELERRNDRALDVAEVVDQVLIVAEHKQPVAPNRPARREPGGDALAGRFGCREVTGGDGRVRPRP